MREQIEIGDVLLGRLRVEQVIQTGGMGTVYIACEPGADLCTPKACFEAEVGHFRGCAVKTLKDQYLDRRDLVDRFVQEAIAWVKLPRDEHIVRAYYIHLIDGRPLLFLEYVKGQDLRQLITTAPISTDLACGIAFQICQGMCHVHESGKILHRDLKPANVLVGEDGTVKITDFGLAVSLEAVLHGNEPRYTAGESIYMAPEQRNGSVSVASEIYSFGVILHELLTGRPPGLLPGGVVVPDKLDSSIPRGLTTMLRRSLARSPHDRYQAFLEIYVELVGLIQTHCPHVLDYQPPYNPYDMMIWQERQLRNVVAPGPGHLLFGSTTREREMSYDEPDNLRKDYLFGHTLACLGHYEDALHYLDPIAGPVDGDSEAGRALILRAHCLNATGEHQLALAALEASLETTIWSDMVENSVINVTSSEVGNARAHPIKGAPAAAAIDLTSSHGYISPDAAILSSFLNGGVCYGAPERKGKHLPFVWAAMAYALLKLGDRKRAMDCLQSAVDTWEAVDLTPNQWLASSRYWPTIWQPLTDSPEYDAAVAGELSADSNLRLLWFLVKGAILLGLKRREEAIDCCNEALKEGVDCPSVWRILYTAWQDSNNARRAMQYIERVTLSDEATWKDWAHQGALHGILGEHLAALRCLDKALSMNPANHVLWLERCENCLCLGRTKDAAQCVEQALALAPEDADSWVERGEVLLAERRYQEAIASYDYALSLNHDHARAKSSRMTALQMSERA